MAPEFGEYSLPTTVLRLTLHGIHTTGAPLLDYPDFSPISPALFKLFFPLRSCCPVSPVLLLPLIHLRPWFPPLVS
jgi:hypothetical protein